MDRASQISVTAGSGPAPPARIRVARAHLRELKELYEATGDRAHLRAYLSWAKEVIRLDTVRDGGQDR